MADKPLIKNTTEEVNECLIMANKVQDLAVNLSRAKGAYVNLW